MKKILLIISLILIVPVIKAQDANDSIRNQIALLIPQIDKLKDDSNKVKLYQEIGEKYLNFRLDSAMLFFTKMKILSKKIDYNGYKRGINHSLYLIYQCCWRLGNYSDGIESQTELLQLSEKNKDTVYLIVAIHNLGYLFNASKDNNAALKYFKKGLIIVSSPKYSNPLHKNKQIITFLGDIGNCFIQLNQIDSALKYTLNSWQLSLNEDIVTQSIATVQMGDVYEVLNKFPEALDHYRTSLDMCNKIGDKETKASVLQFISNTYKKLGNKDSALLYSIAAYNLAKQIQFADGVLKSSESLSKIYAQSKNFDSAFKYQAVYIDTKDSLFGVEKIRQIDGFRAKEDVRQTEIEEQIMQEKEQRKRNIRLGLIAVFIPVFASTVYLLSRKKKKNTKIVSLMGLASLLMLFEFISLIIHPYIEKFTNHDAIFMYLILLIIASLLVPLHHKLEGWIKSKI